jgi:phosphotransferase system HPr-like phosphotransfer protein
MTAASQTFRATVAQVAEKARAILPPTVNGRLEGAIKLVLAHDVTRFDDGRIEVGSCTDPAKVYHLVGTTCECKDFTDGKAPEGWCRHRIAAGIAKRVQELLPQSTPVLTEAAAPAPLPEARSSVNARLMLGAIEIQLTVRGNDEHEVLTRLQAAITTHRLQPVPKAAARAGNWKRNTQGR